MTKKSLEQQQERVKKNAFVHKLYTMLSDPKLSHLIWWSTNNIEGNTFALYPGKEFADCLTQYFKHGNVASFVRQLHMYGFHKVSDPSTSSTVNTNEKDIPPIWEFKHSSGKFRKGDERSLVYIKRRSSSNSSKHTYNGESLRHHAYQQQQQPMTPQQQQYNNTHQEYLVAGNTGYPPNHPYQTTGPVQQQPYMYYQPIPPRGQVQVPVKVFPPPKPMAPIVVGAGPNRNQGYPSQQFYQYQMDQPQQPTNILQHSQPPPQQLQPSRPFVDYQQQQPMPLQPTMQNVPPHVPLAVPIPEPVPSLLRSTTPDNKSPGSDSHHHPPPPPQQQQQQQLQQNGLNSIAKQSPVQPYVPGMQFRKIWEEGTTGNSRPRNSSMFFDPLAPTSPSSGGLISSPKEDLRYNLPRTTNNQSPEGSGSLYPNNGGINMTAPRPQSLPRSIPPDLQVNHQIRPFSSSLSSGSNNNKPSLYSHVNDKLKQTELPFPNNGRPNNPRPRLTNDSSFSSQSSSSKGSIFSHKSSVSSVASLSTTATPSLKNVNAETSLPPIQSISIPYSNNSVVNSTSTLSSPGSSNNEDAASPHSYRNLSPPTVPTNYNAQLNSVSPSSTPGVIRNKKVSVNSMLDDDGSSNTSATKEPLLIRSIINNDDSIMKVRQEVEDDTKRRRLS
ncbi:HSR1 [[Candida] subhashii]|uniref:Heat shock transcription factor n=1 Tax=[Candida] subhashii TaxID=561895 RepID=A0A8J5UVC4_9ASCO|nr:HSR1 [[Candida] subhashii]KAG7660904.1 HSR1 [[Candida] subhashii]